MATMQDIISSPSLYRAGLLSQHPFVRRSDQPVHHQYFNDLYPGRYFRGTQLHTKGVIKVVDNEEPSSEKNE